MDEALQPEGSTRELGIFHFPSQLQMQKVLTGGAVKEVTRPESTGQGGVGEGHLGLLWLWGKDKFKSEGGLVSLRVNSFQVISILDTWVETGSPQNPPQPLLVHPQHTRQRPKRDRFTRIGTLVLFGGHQGEDAK